MAVVLCPAGPLERFVDEVCRAVGADAEVAREVAHHLVGANLAGHDSHGVLRLPWYVEQAGRGQLVPGARPRVVRETSTTALIDAGLSFGHYSTLYALQWAMGRAQLQGLAAASVRQTTHIGRLGEYSERATERGLISIVMVGSAGEGGGIVVPFGGRERFLGTNPWSIGIPAAERPPMIFDAATSTIAEGKLRVARAKGAPVPPGFIVDREGQPSTDPLDFYNGGALLPLGGLTSGHKGYALALAAALLGGLGLTADGGQEADQGGGSINGVFLVVLDPGAFGDGERYRTMVAGTLDAAERVPPAEGAAEVLVPGEPERRSRAQRDREGIPLAPSTWQELVQVAERFGLTPPEHREAEG
jgi:hydroxycarboxylate dehydrogenase B